MPCRQPRVGEFQQLERRIPRQPGLQEPRCRRCEVTYALLELRPEEIGIQRRVIQRRRQQVAIGQQRIRDRVQARLAVRDQAELAAGAQRSGQRPRSVGRGLRVRPRDREQQHARSRALADLLQDEPLLRRPRRRHEQSQVGPDDEVPIHDPAEDRDRRNPGDEQQASAGSRHRPHCLAPSAHQACSVCRSSDCGKLVRPRDAERHQARVAIRLLEREALRAVLGAVHDDRGQAPLELVVSRRQRDLPAGVGPCAVTTKYRSSIWRSPWRIAPKLASMPRSSGARSSEKRRGLLPCALHGNVLTLQFGHLLVRRTPRGAPASHPRDARGGPRPRCGFLSRLE